MRITTHIYIHVYIRILSKMDIHEFIDMYTFKPILYYLATAILERRHHSNISTP